MTIKNPADFISSLVLLAFVGVLYHESLNIRITFIIAYGPRFFPYVIMSALALLAVCLAWQSVDFSGEQKPVADKITVNKTALLMQASFLAAFAAYLILMPTLGYLLSTILFLFSTMILLGERKPKDLLLNAAVACTVAGALYYIFGKVLLIFLP